MEQFLIDTNIPLGIILGQNNAAISAHILNTKTNLHITDFSLKSLFIVSQRNNVETAILEKFVKLLLSKCTSIQVDNEYLLDIYTICEDKNLDFDDAHLYFLAKKKKLKIITYDKHLLKYNSISSDGRLLI